MLMVDKLTKVFYKKVAVDEVSFGVNNGEVFYLNLDIWIIRSKWCW